MSGECGTGAGEGRRIPDGLRRLDRIPSTAQWETGSKRGSDDELLPAIHSFRRNAGWCRRAKIKRHPVPEHWALSPPRRAKICHRFPHAGTGYMKPAGGVSAGQHWPGRHTIGESNTASRELVSFSMGSHAEVQRLVGLVGAAPSLGKCDGGRAPCLRAREVLGCLRWLQRYHMHRRREPLVSSSVSQPPAPTMKSPHRYRIHASRGRLRDELRISAVGSMPKGPRPCQICLPRRAR
ncbi:hypothetical protein BT67DRAFT_184470 [Trichocladium antarcticum]|uniref:Uncharacterized protein n=1 Tax=Trichocladium antarcticum TaxID=1450529 RepID=A0AAN6UNZ9_9PEZI|nr:hypothetical protein BT67DRAFT_184470 [Trichocladium antarcticum]